jgi:hypothetical protein
MTQHTDPLIEAVVEREIAEDDYAYMSFVVEGRRGIQSREVVRRSEKLLFGYLQAMIDARMKALLEADYAGVIDLFGPATTENVVERIEAIQRFTRSHAVDPVAVEYPNMIFGGPRPSTVAGAAEIRLSRMAEGLDADTGKVPA